MSINTIEKKNEVILSRFENKSEGTNISKYSIKFVSGRGCTRVFMFKVTHHEAIQSINDTFGVNNVSEVVKL